ncbi:MAG: DUF4835 family protein [Bacteroidia bacterium]
MISARRNERPSQSVSGQTNSLLMQLFFTAKADEVVNLFSQSPQNEKNDVVQILSLVDPSNTLKYQAILNNSNPGGNK